MKFDDEILMAYADGELDAATRADIEAAMADDPQIARAIERHRAMGHDLRAAFDPMLEEAVPDSLVVAARTAPTTRAANVASIDSARGPVKRPWSWPEWGAMAASLLIGIVVTRFFGAGEENIVARDGLVLATGTLAAALDGQASGGAGDSGIHIALTYRANSGEYCRTFTVEAPAALAGIACHRQSGWRIHTLTDSQHTQTTQYRMAGTAMPPSILQTVQDSIDGEALDAAEESAARERGWQD